MLRFIAWRLLQFPLILAVVYVVTFLLVWVAPGTPFGNNERKLDEKVLSQLKEQYHADRPIRFLTYYPGKMIRGDFGPSLSNLGWTVGDVLAASLPVSMELGLAAMLIAVLVGTTIGVLAAVRRNGILDWLSLAVALLGISVPGFVAAGLLIVIFSDTLHWLPGVGWGTPRHAVLPAVALSLMPLAYIARLTRISMLDVLGNDYIRTARAKGLSKTTVIWRHAFRNAFLPVFTYLGPATAYAMTGFFVIEYVFNIPGLGQHFVNGVKNRDQTLILGTVMVYATFLLALNLLVDVGYSFVDPRIEMSGGEI